MRVERMMVARDSGFGDDYYRHPECDAFHFPTDFEPQLRPITSIPIGRRWCMHCLHWLFDDAHPLDPKPDEQFQADCNAMAAKELRKARRKVSGRG